MRASRRAFLRGMSAIAATGAGPFALDLAAIASASAQSAGAGGYRALVCLYLTGGNDHLNTIVPYDQDSYTAYAAARGGLALPRAALLPLAGGRLALAPDLTRIGALAAAGRTTVLAGVGPLLAPTTKDEIAAGKATLPPLLASHADQQATWLSLATNSPVGWAGRMGDILAGGNGRGALTTISGTGGATLWLAGTRTAPFTVSAAGAPAVFFTPGSAFDDATTRPAARANLLERAVATTYASLRDNAAALDAAMPAAATFPAPPAGNALAQELLTVARVMAAAPALGVTRQVFYVALGGFDTHDAEATRHPLLLQTIDAAAGYFDTLAAKLGRSDSVTLFTMSEFGRHYVPNDDGTDHGWGAHHLVIGPVTGGVRGEAPDMDPNGPDFLKGGWMIPTIAVEQYAATLGRWMGLGETEIADIFPRLNRFDEADLGFLGAG